MVTAAAAVAVADAATKRLRGTKATTKCRLFPKGEPALFLRQGLSIIDATVARSSPPSATAVAPGRLPRTKYLLACMRRLLRGFCAQ